MRHVAACCTLLCAALCSAAAAPLQQQQQQQQQQHSSGIRAEDGGVGGGVKSPFECLEVEDAEECDGFDSCSWCETTNHKYPGSGCYVKVIARILPSRFFTCDKFKPNASAVDAPKPKPAPAPNCFSLKTKGDCKDVDGCSWCATFAGESCFSADTAKFLPDSAIKCSPAPKAQQPQPQPQQQRTPAHAPLRDWSCFGKTTKQDCKDGDGCSWCETSTGKSCFATETARYLPDAKHKCTGMDKPDGASCFGKTVKDECKDADGCSWCETYSGSSCFSADTAKFLPDAKTKCSPAPPEAQPKRQQQKAAPLKDWACFGKMAEDDCTDGDGCAWCTTSSGSSCYAADIAKYLPDAKCVDSSSSSARSKPGGPATGCFALKGKDCDADDACTWCKKGDGSASCFSKQVAQFLPASAFKCADDAAAAAGAGAAQAHFARQATHMLAPTPLDCLGKNDSDSCDKYEACTWCATTSGGLGSGCYPKKVGRLLPEKFFKCDKKSEQEDPSVGKKDKPSPTDCVKQGSASDCDALDGCAWCAASSSSVLTGCYPDKVAELLPQGYFKCDIDGQASVAAAPAAAAAAANVAEDDAKTGKKPSPFECMKQGNAQACGDLNGCAWCDANGGGLGTGCLPDKVADKLPEKFFKCDVGSQAAARPAFASPSCKEKSEDECQAPDCVFCTSAAVGGSCFSPAEAKRLPSAVFHCKPQTVAAR